MVVSLKHAFTSAVADGGDTSLVQPSNWNAEHTLSLAQGNILGRTAAAGTGAATEIPLSFDASNNATFPGQVNLVAGTTSIAPLDFASGSLLTSASAGAIEYDGKVIYATPQGAQRGIIPGMQYYELNSTRTLASSTSAQSWLGVGCTLSSNTVYAFQGTVAASKTTSAASYTLGTGFGGTATLNNIGYLSMRYYDTAGFASVNQTSAFAYVQTAANTTTMTAATATTSYHIYQLNGVVSINAGGTFIPQVTVSNTGPVFTIAIGSNFMIYPIGASGANISVGTWA
jgi:hypothetical protein